MYPASFCLNIKTELTVLKENVLGMRTLVQAVVNSTFFACCLTSVEVFLLQLVSFGVVAIKRINCIFYLLGSDLIDFACRKVCYGTMEFLWLIYFVLANNKLNMMYKYNTPKKQATSHQQHSEGYGAMFIANFNGKVILYCTPICFKI